VIAVASSVAISVALAACGGEAIPSASLPLEIAGLHATSVREIDARSLAAEALDPVALEGLLDAAGFRAALERTYTGPDPAIRRVEIRIVRFDSVSGAERFVDWQQEHAGDVIGDTQPAAQETAQGIPISIHLPDGCCAKEQVLALAAWHLGPDVVRVIVAGPDADGPEAATLIDVLHVEIPADA
jgi:hypothetical protein